MKLTNLTQNLQAEYFGNNDVEICGIAYDSRKVKPGYLFVAIKGFETDGHKYIDSAIANGATAVVGEDDADCSVTYVKVPDSRKALAVCGAQFYDNPQNKLKIIGITGTKGKTTVTCLIKEILENKSKKNAA